MKKLSFRIILIAVVFFVSLFISLPKNIPIRLSLGGIEYSRDFVRPDININIGSLGLYKSFDLVLGLDLAGGSRLVFEADLTQIEPEKKETAVSGVRDIIERRVNLFGVSEPNVQTSSFEGKERIVVELPGITNPDEAIGLIGKTAQLLFVTLEGEGEDVSFTPTELTGGDLKSAQVVFDKNSGKPSISIEFTQEGSEKFEKITQDNIGKPLPILLDNQMVSSPVVQEKISGGNAQITGSFSLEEAKTLSAQLNAGALPVPVFLVEQRTVGATLGVESVEKSIKAGAVGLVMVLLFMIFAYGKLGIIASMALITFGTITLALYKIIPVVLTLPGIAGFLLSVGMAVDSNILIFERFKEERLKRATADALEISFGRAWDSIRDANIATLTTAFILTNPLDWDFLHTSGPVRGFAITLALGVAVSLFTGIYVSRNLLRLFIKGGEKK